MRLVQVIVIELEVPPRSSGSMVVYTKPFEIPLFNYLQVQFSMIYLERHIVSSKVCDLYAQMIKG